MFVIKNSVFIQDKSIFRTIWRKAINGMRFSDCATDEAVGKKVPVLPESLSKEQKKISNLSHLHPSFYCKKKWTYS